MSRRSKEDNILSRLRDQLKALSNRYAIEILQVLSPQTGEMVPTLGWDNIVEGLLSLDNINKPKTGPKGERSQEEVRYEELRQGLMSGGTIYETMNKLVKVGFVSSSGDRGRKQRGFMITHEGRLALASVGQLGGPIGNRTEVQRAAKILLKHKNFTSLLPAQSKFINEMGKIEGNLVIQMPPGSGKTFLAMIVILLRLQRNIKCLYLSPYTSLNRQIIDEYGTLLEELEYSVIRYDGLSSASDDELESADLVVAMYETFASALLQKKTWTSKIGLAIVDELTELDSPYQMQPENLGTDRSAKLDCMITLLKKQSEIITLSSRFGDTNKITEWLDANVFRPDVRLTPDEFIVFKREGGIEIESSDRTQRVVSQQEDLLDAVMDHIENYKEKSILFVVGSRYRAQGIARRLGRSHPRDLNQEVVDQILGVGESLPLSERLANTLKYGTAFHHSGLDGGVRERLEKAIRDRVVRTVVSTTGITSGMSFPFDCVVILLDQNMYFLTARSKYLQIAGRIGEYHLGQHGGRVYLVFEGPTQNFPGTQEMEDTLLHRPLEALNPGKMYPSLAVSVLIRDLISGRPVNCDGLKKKFVEHVQSSYKGTVDQDYASKAGKFFDSMCAWLEREKLLETSSKGFNMTKDTQGAVLSGLDPVDFLQTRSLLHNLETGVDDDTLIDLLLRFRLPQSIRPRTLVPTKDELDIMGLPDPEDWYLKLVPERLEIKRTVLKRWLDEQEVAEIISETGEMARGISLDEGDLDSLLSICGNTASNISSYFRTTKRPAIADRLHVFSRQLQYGVRADVADSDLLELLLIQGDDLPSNRLSRTDARTLYEHGYKSISDVVRKDIDASKKGLARDRFSTNCGLELNIAKEVYKAAMSHIRARLQHDDDDE
ncbi:MAG: DEAD/DEAH box helicase [Candidatus Thorarchaeota archaeon]|nr:DEAD/DEAH box helicase [Candidatus Thorarchaeota archaeon]